MLYIEKKEGKAFYEKKKKKDIFEKKKKKKSEKVKLS